MLSVERWALTAEEEMLRTCQWPTSPQPSPPSEGGEGDCLRGVTNLNQDLSACRKKCFARVSGPPHPNPLPPRRAEREIAFAMTNLNMSALRPSSFVISLAPVRVRH